MNEQRKQIVIFANGIYPFQTRGAEVGIYYLSRELVRQKFRVTVFLSEFVSKANLLGTPKLPDGMKIVPARGISIRFLYNLTFPLITLIDILRGSSRPRVAAVNVPTMMSLISVYALHRISHIPFFVIIHGPSDLVRNGGLIRRVQCALLSKASRLICVSEDLGKTLCQTCGFVEGKIMVIPNGYNRAEVDLARTSSKSKPVSRQLIFAGSLVPAKDPLTLLGCFEEIMRERPDVSLHIVGEGPLKPEMQRRIQVQKLNGSVFFHGTLTHYNLLKLISESTLLVMTSKEEGLPTVAIEALALGKPVVATEVGGLAGLVRDGKNGYLVPLGATGLLVKRILQVLDDLSLRRRLSDEASKSVGEYEWSLIAEQYSSLIESMVKR